MILCISGRTTAQDVNILWAFLEQEGISVAIDLTEHLLMDREPAGLLALRESNGTELRNCSAYVCERIARKRAHTNASETMW